MIHAVLENVKCENGYISSLYNSALRILLNIKADGRLRTEYLGVKVKMNGKEELIRRTMQIIKEIFQKNMRTISYCKSNMEWRFNHISGYGLYCARVREALQVWGEEGRRIRHREYHVQVITEQVHLVNGIFSIVPEQEVNDSLEIPFEIVVCMCDGMAECIHIYGTAPARLLFQVRSFHEETWFLESTEILYIESAHNNVIWHCREYQVESRDTLKRLEQCLPDAFVRIHRCYIINVRQIHKIRGNEVEMINGDILTIPVRNGTRLQREILSKAEKSFLSRKQYAFLPENGK